MSVLMRCSEFILFSGAVVPGIKLFRYTVGRFFDYD